MSKLKWLWKNMGSKKHFFILGITMSLVLESAIIVVPIIDKIIIERVTLSPVVEGLLSLLIFMVVFHFIRMGLRYVNIIILEINSQQTYKELRRKMYNVIQNQDYLFFAENRTGDLVTRTISDLDFIRHALFIITLDLADTIAIFTSAFIYFYTMNKQITLSILVVAPFTVIISYFFTKKISPLYKEQREKLTKLNTMSQENIAGNRIIKAFANEQYEMEKFDKENKEYLNHNMKIMKTSERFHPIISVLGNVINIIIIVLGGYNIMKGNMTIAQLTSFIALSWAFSFPFENLPVMINDIQRFSTAAQMIMEVQYSNVTIKDKKDAKVLEKRPEGNIEFSNVSFKIGKNEILKNISFKINKNETLGIIGSTGSGKTSLINMLMHFYKPTNGKVTLDGDNIENITLKSLRKNIGLATQEVFLFSDTIDSNVAYGNPEMPEEDVIKYAKVADVDDFAKNTIHGYETVIGERGVGLSGGQRQRIALARALAIEPSILILDDTTSAVDMETERYIQSGLRNLDFDCTKIIIAQRISSISDADHILVLDDGEITHQGKHKDLIKEKGLYQEIWALQNGIDLNTYDFEKEGDYNGT